jgi:hypothetical protein
MSPFADAEKRREVRRRRERKAKGCKPWRPGGPGRPPKGARMEPQCKLPDRMRAEHEFDAAGKCACGASRQVFAPRPELRAVVPQTKGQNHKAPAAPAEKPAYKTTAKKSAPPEAGDSRSVARRQPDLPSGGKSAAVAPAAPAAPARVAAPSPRKAATLPQVTEAGLDYTAVLADLERRRDALEDEAAELATRLATAERAIAALRELVQPEATA